MARATRSSTQHEKPKQQQQPDPPSTKKRKRPSQQDSNDFVPASKLPRTDIDSGPNHDQRPSQPTNFATHAPHLAGDAPIPPEHAQKILDILEVSDSQGLLDRVFPLPAEAPDSTPQSQSLRGLLKDSSQHPLWVLRAAVKHLLPISSHPRFRPSTPAAQQRRFCELALSLLDQASFHTVPVPLHLQTILPEPEPELSSDDSTITTKPAPSTNNATSTSPPTSTFTSPPSPVLAKLKYALVQHLPNGDYWTSLNSDIAATSTPSIHDQHGLDLKDLPTGHAELVAILPTASSALIPLESVPTLGSYNSTKPLAKKPLPAQRRLTAGSFLDYGVWASFAPTFNQEAELLGRREMGEIIWRREDRKRQYEDRRREWAQGRGRVEEVADDDDIVEIQTQKSTQRMSEVEEGNNEAQEARMSSRSPTTAQEEQEITEIEGPSIDSGSKKTDSSDLDHALKELLPPEQAEAVKSALAMFELEMAVQELLERNARALARLEELQYARLSKEGGGTSKVEEGSVEWETAQGIMESLTVLASLRPRSSADDSSLIPIPSVLRKLHRTLALEPKPGWYGSLPSNQTTALRDDSTIKLRPGVLNPTATAAAGTPGLPASSTPTPLTNAQHPNTTSTLQPQHTTTATATPYAGYAYAYNPQQTTANAGTATTTGQPYRPAATQYTPYKPGQAPYYNAYMAGQGAMQQGYYGQQAYVGAATTGGTANSSTATAATGQQPYAAYSNWYATYAPMAVPGASTTPGTTTTTAAGAVAAAGSTSGRGTPQPGVNTANPVAIPTSYATFFSGGAGAGTGAGTSTTPPTPGGASQRTPVVANTVMAGKTPYTAAAAAGYQTMGQWAPGMGMYGQTHYQYQQGAGATAGVIPTLPVHLRPNNVGQGQGQVQPATYYGAYQQQLPNPSTPASATPR